MTDIIAQLKELKERAESGDMVKRKYVDLSSMVNKHLVVIDEQIIAIKHLLMITEQKRATRMPKEGKVPIVVAKQLYTRLLDGKEVDAKACKEVLRHNGFADGDPSVCEVFKELRKLNGVSCRRDRTAKVYFYGANPSIAEQQDAAIKFGKVSIMG